MNRKEFLRTSALASAGSLLLPRFLKALEGPGTLPGGEKVLVIVQLGGGNDGLNTVVNFRNDHYYKARPQLAISAAEVLRLTDDQGLHPALAPLQPLFDAGEFAIVNAVGYPNPDRSHFRSMDIWQTASGADRYLDTGWVGRYLDANCQAMQRPTGAIEVGDRLSLALKGQHLKGLAVQDPRQFHATAASPWLRAISEAHTAQKHGHVHAQADYLYKTLGASIASAEYIFETSKTVRNRATYPGNPLARNLRKTAQMILAGLDTRVYYVDMGGFDTHVNQAGQHKRLLGNYAGAMAAFVEDLKAGGRWQDVAVLTFSEFGRRVAQNASNGTDHGTANNLFLMGGALKRPGIVNPAPDLFDLDQGDLKFQVDFRQVYAELLQHWLSAPAEEVLGGKFARLGII